MSRIKIRDSQLIYIAIVQGNFSAPGSTDCGRHFRLVLQGYPRAFQGFTRQPVMSRKRTGHGVRNGLLPMKTHSRSPSIRRPSSKPSNTSRTISSSRSMGKQGRKFETGFKQQIASEIESGTSSVSAGSRKYPVALSIAGDDRLGKMLWKLHRRFGKKPWKVRTVSSRKSWPSRI